MTVMFGCVSGIEETDMNTYARTSMISYCPRDAEVCINKLKGMFLIKSHGPRNYYLGNDHKFLSLISGLMTVYSKKRGAGTR